MFNERKTAQMAVYFLNRADGTMDKLKLMKLLYLAEREALHRYGMPMTGDYLVSMDHGPVLSKTLDLARGISIDPADKGWDTFIARQGPYTLHRINPITDSDLDELSQADVEVLVHVWQQFGHMDGWGLRNYTHTLPEWENPHGTSIPINYKNLLVALNYSETEAEALCDQIAIEDAIDHTFQAR